MPLNTSLAVTRPYSERPDADDRELSAVRLVQALLAAPDLLVTHRNEMLRIALYKYTEARSGKFGLRYRTVAVADTAVPVPVVHEHVRPRQAVVADLCAVGDPVLVPLILSTAVTCLVTDAEHSVLNAVPTSVHGWARYAAAGLKVVDHLTGDVVDPAVEPMMSPVVDLDRLSFLRGGGATPIALLMACRLVNLQTSMAWAGYAAARDSNSPIGDWLKSRIDTGCETGLAPITAAYRLGARIFDTAVLAAASDAMEAVSTGVLGRRQAADQLVRTLERDGARLPRGDAAVLARAALEASCADPVPPLHEVLRRADLRWPRGVGEDADTYSVVDALTNRYREPLLDLALSMYTLRLRGALPVPPPGSVVDWLEQRLPS
ncbi:hypothetical protein SAMN04488107_2517 [Geodermatophilus saharensis]|uniref:Uncharacterized protein n=1 Tax=Geodermatophilus saharensis TaxID=1137994 RepID=A0A239EEB6_9ACTN|nr:hypothetical protein [Geodermatophilus saharensis]SNS43015.1 hypothetical protein SAMN04488107_2517 [Geodermatophilus saharensis]